MKWIIQFVLKQLAKLSGKKTGITTLTKASDPSVELSARQIKQTLTNMGVDVNKLKSTDEVSKYLNIHESLMKQRTKKTSQGLASFMTERLGKTPKKKPTTESLLKGEEYVDESGRSWTFAPGTKQKDLPEWTKGWTPKIVPKDKTLLKDSPEAIAKIKAENKAALERLRKKKLDEEPDDLASGGIAGQLHLYDGGRARLGMAGGGALWKFIEGLFIKASNDIRQGKGLFKGLTDKQKWAQHDNLTKMVTQWQKTKKLPEGSEQYFGIDAEKAFAAAQTKVKKVDLSKTKKVDKNRKLTDEEWKDFVEENSGDLNEELLTGDETLNDLENMVAEQRAYADDMYQQYKRGDLDKYVKPEVLEEQRLFRQKKIDKVLDKAYDEVFYQKPVTGDYKYDADVLSDSIAEQLGKGSFTDLPQTHQTQIYNTALKRVTQDMQMKQTLKKVEEKMQLSDFDTKGRKPNASGGIAREGYAEGTSSPRFKHPDKREGILGSGVTWTELMEDLHPFMWSPGSVKRTKRDIIDPFFKKKIKWDELDEYYKQLEMDKDMRDPENVPRRREERYAASGGIAGQLHLNQGGRVSFTKGGKVSRGLAHVLGV